MLTAVVRGARENANVVLSSRARSANRASRSCPIRRRCSRDVTTVCEGSQSEQNRFNECVKLRFPDLSESCKASLVRIATVLKACAADIQEQCHLIKPGAGRVFLCVKQHFSALSAPCKEAIATAAERK